MKRLSVCILGFLCLFVGVGVYHHVNGQSSAGIPFYRTVGTTSIVAWTPVKKQTCGTPLLCIQPTIGGDIVSGIAMTSGNPGDQIPVMMSTGGVAQCVFLNTPVQGDIAIPGAGGCSDVASSQTVSNTADTIGVISQVIDSTHAYVTLRIARGDSLQTSTMPGLATVATTGSYADLLGKPTIPAPQVNSDWNAVSGISQILNKPSLSSGTVTSFGNGTWPSWLIPSVSNPTTTPTESVTASAIPNSALANASVTVNGQTCALGSSCTITSVSYYLNGTLIAGTGSGLKIGVYTGTTSGSGTATISLTGMGLGTILGFPTVNAQGAGPFTTNTTASSTSSVSILINSGSVVTILGINIISLGGAAVPYSVTVLGY